MGDVKTGSFKDLLVWQKSFRIAINIYKVTRDWPESERFGLTNQVRRAAVSVPSNIAEGQARRTPKEFVQFLYISRGSLAELETQLLLASELGFGRKESAEALIREIDDANRMLFNLIRSIENRKTKA